MGRLIDADEVDDAIYKCFEGIQFYDGTGYDIYSDSKESIDKIPTVEAILKADYENRLKADLVAMLTELQLEIEELENPLDYDFEGYNQCAVDCEKLIQQKINSLKEAQNDREKDI